MSTGCMHRSVCTSTGMRACYEHKQSPEGLERDVTCVFEKLKTIHWKMQ